MNRINHSLAQTRTQATSANDLGLLYQISKLFQQTEKIVPDILSKLVLIIPQAWEKQEQIVVELLCSRVFVSDPLSNRDICYKQSFVIPNQQKKTVLTIFDLTEHPKQSNSDNIDSKLDFIHQLVSDISDYLTQKHITDSLIEEQQKRVKQLDAALAPCVRIVVA